VALLCFLVVLVHTIEADTPYGCLFAQESIVVVDLSPSFWANYGYNMGIKPVFNENSKMLKVPTPTPT
jgi:hypothetical protein